MAGKIVKNSWREYLFSSTTSSFVYTVPKYYHLLQLAAVLKLYQKSRLCKPFIIVNIPVHTKVSVEDIVELKKCDLKEDGVCTGVGGSVFPVALILWLAGFICMIALCFCLATFLSVLM